MSVGIHDIEIEHVESKLASGTVNGDKFRSILKGKHDRWKWDHTIEGESGDRRSIYYVLTKALDIRQSEMACIERDKRLGLNVS